MYCPKCGTQNADDIKFCRSCGANLSLVPQALSGQLQQERAVGHDAEGHPYDRHGRRMDHQPSIGRGVQQAFMGLAFLIIAATLYISGQKWGLWMLIPAFGLLGSGFAQIATVKHSQRTIQPAAPPARKTGELAPQRDYSSLPPQPPSVTEQTTRHLDSTSEQQSRDTK